MDVFDLPGPEFLRFYAWLIGIGLVAAIVLRRWLRSPGGEPPQVWDERVGPYGAAYLAGGADAALAAATAALLHGGAIEAADQKLTATGIPAVGLHPLELAVVDAIVADAP